MDPSNPIYVPRNQLVEDALAAAVAGDLGPYERLVEALTRPFEPRAGFEAYALPSPVPC
jgi:serine/tyrosine/threonine adenylyltransferase